MAPPAERSVRVSKRLTPPDAIAVLGSGNMGSGIAQACAQAGFPVRVRDLTEAQIARGRGIIESTLDGALRRKKITPAQRAEILGRIHFTTDLGEAVRGTQLVIEAVFEEESVKKAVFEEAGPHLGPETIVATNTSSLSVSRLATHVPEPSRFAGLHFFYPAPINKLLEVVGGDATRPEVLATLERFAYDLRKIPIRTKDSAGFCVNRFFVPYMNEATRIAEDGLGSWATIEEVGREVTGAAHGPFEIMNLTGPTIAHHACQSLADAFGPFYDPTDLLEEQTEKKVPWDWRASEVEPARKPAIRARFEGAIWGIATRLVEEGVASAEAVETGAAVGLRWKNTPFAQINAVGVPRAYECVQEFARRWEAAFPVSADLKARAERKEHDWPIQLVRLERKESVAWVLLDRPAALNSLNTETFHQLHATFRTLAHDPSVRAVVLAGAGPVFSAGADVAEMSTKSVAEARAFGFLGQEVCRAIEEFPAPVIALVEGVCPGRRPRARPLGGPYRRVGDGPGRAPRGDGGHPPRPGRGLPADTAHRARPHEVRAVHREPPERSRGRAVRVRRPDLPRGTGPGGDAGPGGPDRDPGPLGPFLGEDGGQSRHRVTDRRGAAARGRVREPHVRHLGPDRGDGRLPGAAAPEVRGPVARLSRGSPGTRRRRGTSRDRTAPRA